MTKLPWFPFYGRDFFFDERVKLFTLRQQGIYLFLLWHQWEEGTIPDLQSCLSFPAFIADPASVDPSSINDVEMVHTTCFQPYPQAVDRYYNVRLEKIRVEQLEKLEKIHNRAVKGGLAKAQHKQSLGTTQAELKHILSTASQNQIQKEERKESPLTPLVDNSGNGREDNMPQLPESKAAREHDTYYDLKYPCQIHSEQPIVAKWDQLQVRLVDAHCPQCRRIGPP